MASSENDAKKRPVALVDVDNTLVFESGEKITYNANLLASLEEHGIKDIYLFTSMTSGEKDITDRQNLIEHLKKQGFTVHGVISTMDLVWSNRELALDFQRKVENEAVSTGARREGIKDIARDILNSPKKTYDKLKDFSGAIAGAAFKEITEPGGKPDEKEEATALVNAVKTIRLGQNDTYESEKAAMLHMFQQNVPEWVSSIVVIDDGDANIKAVKEIHNAGKYQTPVIAIHSQVDRRKELTADEYHDKFAEYREQHPEQFESSVKTQIKKLNSEVVNFIKLIDQQITNINALREHYKFAENSNEFAAHKAYSNILTDYKNSLESSLAALENNSSENALLKLNSLEQGITNCTRDFINNLKDEQKTTPLPNLVKPFIIRLLRAPFIGFKLLSKGEEEAKKISSHQSLLKSLTQPETNTRSIVHFKNKFNEIKAKLQPESPSSTEEKSSGNSPG